MRTTLTLTCVDRDQADNWAERIQGQVCNDNEKALSRSTRLNYMVDCITTADRLPEFVLELLEEGFLD
jgi:hypothetical protein